MAKFVESYRNERFTRGNKVSLFYNPREIIEANLSNYDTSPVNRDFIEFDNAGSIDSTFDNNIICCPQFGGILNANIGVISENKGLTDYLSAVRTDKTTGYAQNPLNINQDAILLKEQIDSNTTHYGYTNGGTQDCYGGEPFTFSIMVKDAGIGTDVDYIRLQGSTALFGGSNATLYFSLLTGEASNVSDTVIAYGSSYYGDGWWRFWFTLRAIKSIIGSYTVGQLIIFTAKNIDGLYTVYFDGVDTRGILVDNAAITRSLKPFSVEPYSSTTRYTQTLNNRITLSKDTFLADHTSWLESDYEKFHIFDNNKNVVSDVHIADHRVSVKNARYGSYEVNYNSNDNHEIMLIVEDIDIDTARQIAMSEAVAVKSCDDYMTEGNSVVSGMNTQKPLGGGSFNPLVRQASVLDASIEKKSKRFSVNLALNLLG